MGGNLMAKFISDEEMAQLEASQPTQSKKFISDEEMAQLEASQPSELESAARGLIQGATMGFADEISGGLEALWEKAKGNPTVFGELYKAKRDESRANYEAAEKANPKSYLAGQVGGGIGTAIIPGMGGATLGKLALQGAAHGLGSSEADLTEGDITGAVRDTAIGGTVGAATGLAGKALSAGAAKASPYIKSGMNKLGDVFEDSAEKLAVKATGATGNQASKFQPNAGRELLDQGLVKFGDDASRIAERVGQRHELAGKAIGESIDTLQERGIMSSVDNIVDGLQSQVDELAKTPGNERLISQLQKEIDNLYLRGESNIGIKTAEQAKRNFQGQTNYFSDEAEKKASARIADAFKKEVERAATEADPTLASKFMDEKKVFGLLSPIKEAAERRAMQQSQSPFGGLTDIVVGSTMGPTGLAKKYGIQELGRRTASSGAVMSDAIADIVRTQPQRLGKFAKPLQEAAQRGGNSLAATHYVLQQTNPEYRQLVNTSEDDRDEQED